MLGKSIPVELLITVRDTKSNDNDDGVLPITTSSTNKPGTKETAEGTVPKLDCQQRLRNQKTFLTLPKKAEMRNLLASNPGLLKKRV